MGGRVRGAAIVIGLAAATLVSSPAGAGAARTPGSAGSAGPPTLSISDVQVKDGGPDGASLTSARFVVTLSKPATHEVRVRYGTHEGTATASTDSQPGDFDHLRYRFVIEPGRTRISTNVIVRRDCLDEPDERFRMKLSDPVGAVIDDGVGVATIVDQPWYPCAT